MGKFDACRLKPGLPEAMVCPSVIYLIIAIITMHKAAKLNALSLLDPKMKQFYIPVEAT
jgi:hypothetical protein